MSLQVEQPASAAVIATAASSLALVLVLVLVLAPCAAFPCRLVQCIAVCSS